MEPPVIAALRGSRLELLAEWRRLLRNERVVSPLAEPSSLDHLMASTLDDVTILVGQAVDAKNPAALHLSEADIDAASQWPPPCRCEQNPFQAYYRAGEIALCSLLTQSSQFAFAEEYVNQVKTLWRVIAREELESFCGLCKLSERPTVNAPRRARGQAMTLRRRLLPASLPCRRILV